MKMQTVFLVLLLTVLTLLLTSCYTETAEAGNNGPFNDRFVRYHADYNLVVYVDKGTGVCYLWNGVGYKGGLTVMLDEDGRPLTYWEDDHGRAD